MRKELTGVRGNALDLIEERSEGNEEVEVEVAVESGTKALSVRPVDNARRDAAAV